MERFYFTYGSEGHPFVGGWTEVEAQDYDVACAAFRVYHPNGSHEFMRCSCIYDEEEFMRTTMHQNGNMGAYCHETITLQRKLANN